MLIIFHFFAFFVLQILKNKRQLKINKNCDKNEVLENEKREYDLKFDPPLYRQRYAKVYDILIREKWRNKLKKIVDFGCAEFGIFVFLKYLNFNEIVFVDIDKTLLEEKIGHIEPLLVDKFKRRNCPLEVSVFVGSVSDPDYRLLQADVVTAIELIEHLYPDTLDAFPYNIFSYLKAKLVIITTPNREFNVLFNKLEVFRHPDHKFEWTREQFEDWSKNIIERFPDYTVEFYGLGDSPSDKKHLGYCSQMAVFVRKDLLNEEYISLANGKQCLCDINSPCKGQTTECKLMCNCVCPSCIPDYSIGICSYLSCTASNEKLFDNSNSDFDAANNDTSEGMNDINPSHNIFYQCLQRTDYPFEVDLRTENERLLETLSYRINAFSFRNSRFYVDERERCEIPVLDIMYGDINVSVEEICNLLTSKEYKIEKCIIQETGLSETCVISLPHEMEEFTSSSDITEEYSSKSTGADEGTKFETNIESDWDDENLKENKDNTKEGTATLEHNLILTNPKPDPLFDSGYLNSPSPLETTQKLPQLSPPANLEQTNPFEDVASQGLFHKDNKLQLRKSLPKEKLIGSPLSPRYPPETNPILIPVSELVETSQIEDAGNSQNFLSSENKLHIKKTAAKDKFVGSLLPESNRQKVDPNRVNELDRFRTMTAKTFANNHLKSQSEFKKSPIKDSVAKDISVPGPSGWKKGINFKECKEQQKTKKEVEKKDQEPSVLDDAKSITNCIIQNSLNKIEMNDQICSPRIELLRDLYPQQDIIQEWQEAREAPQEEHQVNPNGAEENAAIPVMMENSDLANNNRDNEGNNFDANNMRDIEVDEGIDLLNDNLEELMPLLGDNVNIADNNNELPLEGNDLERLPQILGENILEHVDDVNDDLRRNNQEGISQASREALFDVNSEQDLLDDFDIPPQANEDNIFDILNLGTNVVLVGFQPTGSDGIRSNEELGASSVETNTTTFPNWLLQILGSHVTPEEAPQSTLGTHDEPHFYCQGDGLGVHPSVIAVEIDEAEDADNDSTEESSSNNTVDYAEVEPGPSDMFDMSSLPEESSVGSILRSERGTNTSNMSCLQSNSSRNSRECVNEYQFVNDIIQAAQEEIERRSVNVVQMSHNILESTNQLPINESCISSSSGISDTASKHSIKSDVLKNNAMVKVSQYAGNCIDRTDSVINPNYIGPSSVTRGEEARDSKGDISKNNISENLSDCSVNHNTSPVGAIFDEVNVSSSGISDLFFETTNKEL